MAAMDLDKHVYVQKPLTWSVDEARRLARKARQTPKVVTQMGNQGHSWDDGRKAVEWVQSGAIGDVTEVHVWTNRPLAYWPQGIPRPEPQRISARAALEHERRDGAARQRDGHLFGARRSRRGICSSARRRAWSITRSITRSTGAAGWTGACGALGDMGAHLIDHAYWALDLGYPTTIETVSTPFDKACFPMATNDLLRVPGARLEAAGEAHVVRRRHVPADARPSSAKAKSSTARAARSWSAPRAS